MRAERKSLQARLAALDRGSTLRGQGALPGDNTPTSDALDTIQEAMAKEGELTLRETMIERLKVLARAEEKMRQGTYGICEACGQPIPPARLRAVPEAVLCVRCAEAEEPRALRSR
jgi:RNA polymerase-binding transcription factor DksA